LCSAAPALHNPSMQATHKPTWFGARRPWLWLGVTLAAWVIFALAGWALLELGSRSHLEAERGVAPAGARLPAAAATELDPLATWVLGFVDRALPESHFPSYWPLDPTEPPDLSTRSRSAPWGAVTHGLAIPYGYNVPSVTLPAECESLRAEIEGLSFQVESWLDATLNDPARIEVAPACVLQLLAERSGSEELRERALRARDLPVADSDAWLARMVAADRGAPEPALHPIPTIAGNLAALAALRALESDADAARGALDALLRLCESLAELRWLAGFQVWAESESIALRGLGACLAISPALVDTDRVERHLVAIQAASRLPAILSVQWALCDRSFERAWQGKSLGIESLDAYLPHLQLTGPLFRHEQADALASWRRAAAWSAEPAETRGGIPAYERSWIATDELGSQVLGAPTALGESRLEEIEDRIVLLRLALTAHRDGTAAALAAGATTRARGRSNPPLASVRVDGVLEVSYPDSGASLGSTSAPARVVRIRAGR
jgi:hypothetical protein